MTVILCSCQSEDKYTYYLQAENGGNMKIGAPIFYLGIEVGLISEINFVHIDGKDYVLASFELNDKSILNKSSYMNWSSTGALEIINSSAEAILQEKDTITLKVIENNEITIPHQITPISNEELLQSEKEVLSPEDQIKLDSLQTKINKLNNLIKEVNDQD